MKKLFTRILLLFLVVAFGGCSFRPMYIIRNSSEEPATVVLTIKGVNDSTGAGNWEIPAAAEIVPLKKSNLTTAFISKITGTWDRSGACEFKVPAGWSVDITNLLEHLSPERDHSASFNGSAVKIKYGSSALILGNNIAEVQSLFEIQSFFLSGPLVYYFDLE